jgi:hypothetical protein
LFNRERVNHADYYQPLTLPTVVGAISATLMMVSQADYYEFVALRA